MEENQVVSLEPKIGPDAAQAQLDMFLEYYEIDLEDIENEKAQQAMQTSINKLKKAIRKCRAEIKLEGDSLVVVQQLKKAIDRSNGPRLESVTYKELSGQAKIRLKDREENDNYGQVYALMGGLCGEPDSTMLMFKGVDLATMEAIASIFLAV
jgi:predicted PilT family ATPase